MKHDNSNKPDSDKYAGLYAVLDRVPQDEIFRIVTIMIDAERVLYGDGSFTEETFAVMYYLAVHHPYYTAQAIDKYVSGPHKELFKLALIAAE